LPQQDAKKRAIFFPNKEEQKLNGAKGVPPGHINSVPRFFAGKAARGKIRSNAVLKGRKNCS
jgi:hypothetical protein